MRRPCRCTVFNKRSDQRPIKWKQVPGDLQAMAAMVLFIMPNTRLALLYAAWQFLDNFKMSVTMTPKSFSSLVLAKTWPFNSHWNSRLPLPMCRTLHLDVLNSFCRLLDQSANDEDSSNLFHWKPNEKSSCRLQISKYYSEDLHQYH